MVTLTAFRTRALAGLTTILMVAPGVHSRAKAQTQTDGVAIGSGANRATMTTRVQVRWRDDQLGSRLDMPRLRLTLSGGAYRPWLRYTIQYELGETSGGRAGTVKDVFTEIRRANGPHRIRIGRVEAPFGPYPIGQRLVDFAITETKFSAGRQTGVLWLGSTASRRISYAAGMFNQPDAFSPQAGRPRHAALYVTRVVVSVLGTGERGAGPSDRNMAPALRAGVAAYGGRDTQSRAAIMGTVAFDTRRFFATAEYFRLRNVQQTLTAAIESRGMAGHVGVRVTPATALSVWFAGVDGDASVTGATVSEIRAVLLLSSSGNAWRIHIDGGQIRYGAAYATLSSAARQGLRSPGLRAVSGRSFAETEVRALLQFAF